MVKAQTETTRQFGLNRVHFGTILRNRFARFRGRKLGRCSMLIRGTQKHNLMAARALITGEQVGRQLRANKISKMLDPVDVRDRRCNEVPGHLFVQSAEFDFHLAEGLGKDQTVSQRSSRDFPVSLPIRKLVRGA